MRDPRFNMEIESMRMNAESQLRGKHGGRRGRGGSSMRSILIRLVLMIGLAVAFFWWIYS